MKNKKTIMKTKILKANQIKEAAEILKKGGIVAFPTETVYGLGAILNKKAVDKIFIAKGRPTDNPIIVHIANKKDIYKLASVPDKKIVNKLIKKFWPGPLTFILKKKKIVPNNVTAGLDTVAIRMPANKIALALIKRAGPIVAPSANISGRPSPTSAKHVIHDLSGRIDAIIDGGKTKIGVESTVIDITKKPAVLLRPGGVTFEQLKKIIDIEIHPSLIKKSYIKKPSSPGMKYRHYAPNAKLILVLDKKKMKEVIKSYKGKVGVLSFGKKYNKNTKVLRNPSKDLFKTLREFDEEGYDIIISESMEEKGIGLAVMNRLKKAATKIIK